MPTNKNAKPTKKTAAANTMSKVAVGAATPPPAAAAKKASSAAGEALSLICPIRGMIKPGKKASGDLSSLEERHRIDAIKHLLSRGYKHDNILIEAVICKFGADGRNSFRCDFAVLDVAVVSIDKKNVDELLKHAVILGEVKRDSAKYELVLKTQVEPMLGFSTLKNVVGVYWDESVQRVFWKEHTATAHEIKSGPLQLLPTPGNKINVKPLEVGDLRAPKSMIDLFDRIEDLLHASSANDLEARYEVMLQLIVTKIFDEHQSESNKERPLVFQDYTALGTAPETAEAQLNELLEESASFYQAHLPKTLNGSFGVDGHVLLGCATLLSEARLTGAKKEVMQTFYMKFAKDLYRWDLAQYFTPPTVTDFIVELLNPTSGELVKDPACGSADFLVATFHRNRALGIKKPAEGLFGADNDKKAVQISVLNMLLNGDGKTNVKEEDSLKATATQKEAAAKDKKFKPQRHNVMVCNPPFGVKILERRSEVLKHFELGHAWSFDKVSKKWKRGAQVLESQEKGLLFAEVCVDMTKPKGRIGIVLPNGYLGNRSERYVAFREWLLRNCRVVSICGFPRFTFKTSGADVSASIVVLEKRDTPLADSSGDPSYVFNAELIENVGWNVGDKAALPQYERDPLDGSFLPDQDGEKKIKADFDRILDDVRRSQVVAQHPWLTKGLPAKGPQPFGWSRPIDIVLTDKYLTLDPKRHCKKYVDLVNVIKNVGHVALTDVFELLGEKKTSTGVSVSKSDTAIYHHVEIDSMDAGPYRASVKRGWELPDRAKHFAEGGDIYIGSIWSSVSKWCLIEDAPLPNTVVTNGCHRLRLKTPNDPRLLDAVAFFCSEAYTTQMRALARGSDGMAEIHEDDLAQVLIPLIVDPAHRTAVAPYLASMKKGAASLKTAVTALSASATPILPTPPARPHHSSLV